MLSIDHYFRILHIESPIILNSDICYKLVAAWEQNYYTVAKLPMIA